MFLLNYSTIIDPLLKDVRLYVPKFAGMKAGDRVLDICCGTGDQVFHYAEKGIVATGVDINPKMLEVAIRNKKRQGLEDVSFHLADAANLPFNNSYFDYASICFGLHDKEREIRDKVISEMKRVVKREGNLIFIDFQVPLPNSPYGYLAKIIEFLAGGAHYKSFRDYINRGGLDKIIRNHKLIEENRDYLKSRLVVIIRARNT